jgi:hypothetical protein
MNEKKKNLHLMLSRSKNIGEQKQKYNSPSVKPRKMTNANENKSDDRRFPVINTEHVFFPSIVRQKVSP